MKNRAAPRRRKIYLFAGLAVAITVLLLPLFDPPPVETGAYLQGVTQTEAVVCRWSAEPERCRLRVFDGAGLVAEVEAEAPTRHHELRVGGLVAGAEYRYELLDPQGGSAAEGRFVTRSDDDRRTVRFALIGDSGGQPWWIALQQSALFHWTSAQRWLPVEDEPRAVARVLADIAPQFCLHMGDVIYPKGEHETYATGLYRPFGEMMRNVPVYPVLGNHDCRTGDGAPFLEHFALPEGGGGGERNFTFTDGPVRFIGLDLNTRVGGPEHPAMLFLRRTAEASSEPWLVVWSHYPVQSAYREEPRADLAEFYLPLCRELGVDLVCAGHDHNYQRFGEPGETIQVVTGGGGKSLYEILRRPTGLVVAASAYHACEVVVDGATLRLRALAIDGSVLDDFTIDKAAQVRDGRDRTDTGGGAPGRAGRVWANPARLARLRSLVE